jgi:hypothetical protein
LKDLCTFYKLHGYYMLFSHGLNKENQLSFLHRECIINSIGGANFVHLFTLTE